MKTVILYHGDFKLHDPSPYLHPENPYRLDRIVYAMHAHGVTGRVKLEEPPRLNPFEAFKLVHTSIYLEEVGRALREAGTGEPYWIDADTYVSKGTRRALERLAGAALVAAKNAVKGEAGLVILLGRPPSHHAGRSGRAMNAPTLGFCILNATALIAAILSTYGRVAVVDFDLHHGNGTQEIFYNNASVLHVDIHQDYRTIYPGSGSPEQSGAGDARGTKININLPVGSKTDIGLDALETAKHLVEEWKPDFIVVSAGFDAYKDDNEMSLIALSSPFYHEAGAWLRSTGRPVIAVLEGGYGVGLESGFAAFVYGLMGLDDPIGDEVERSSSGVWDLYREMKGKALEEAGMV